jgi:hypothetical protein
VLTNENAEVVVLPSVYVIPETSLRATLLAPAVPSPIEIVVLALCVNVPVNPVKFRERQTFVEFVFVTVTAPEDASKNTSSAAAGTA